MKNNAILQYIKECEQAYRELLSLSSFPDYDIEFFEFTSEQLYNQQYPSFASAKYDLQSGEHTLKIWSNIHTLGEIGKQTLFHELTHIYDDDILINKDPYKYKSFHGYSEYHASQIQFLRILGTKSIIKCPSFSMNDIINTKLGTCSIQKYIETQISTAVDILHQSRTAKKTELFVNGLGVLFNYYGCRSICIMYATDYQDTANYSAISQRLSPYTVKYLNDFLTT